MGRVARIATALVVGLGALSAMAIDPPLAAAAGSVQCTVTPCPTLAWERTVGGTILESSPNLADINGDNVLDVSVGSQNGSLYVVNGATGADVGGWPQNLGNGINSSPAVADVDGDGKPELFVGSGLPNTSAGALWSFRSDGGQRFKFNGQDRQFSSPSFQSTPAIGDVNNDSRADVSVGALALSIWSLDHAGGVNWNHDADDTVFSSPALVDVNGDGFSDIVIGGDSTPGGTIDNGGGIVRALNGINGQELWRFFTSNAIVRSSPSVGDIDGDGVADIVVGVGDEPGGTPGPDSKKVLAFNLNGTMKSGFPVVTDGITFGSPALADTDGDGILDIIVGTGGSGHSVYIIGGNGGIKKTFDSTGGVVIGSIVAGDLDGDGVQDVLVPTGAGMVGFRGDGTKLFVLNVGQVGYQNSAAIGDIDGNGRLDIVTAGGGFIHRFQYAQGTGGTVGPKSWPLFRKDARRTGSTTNPPLAKSNCPTAGAGGYWMASSDGGIFAFCDAKFHGSTGNIKLNRPVVAIASTLSGHGYWMVASDGGIFSFGDAAFKGSTGNITLNQPIVGMARTASGNGYWMVASDGGVFAFGDAAFKGSTGNIKLNQPIVGMATTPSGNGYWLFARDGGVFAFGDAGFKGSTGNIKLNQPIVGAVATPSGAGYWMVASDGGVFAFGDATFKGSTGNIKLNRPIVGMARTTNGDGYYMVASDGGIFAFNAPFLGSTGNIKLAQPMIGMAVPGV